MGLKIAKPLINVFKSFHEVRDNLHDMYKDGLQFTIL